MEKYSFSCVTQADNGKYVVASSIGGRIAKVEYASLAGITQQITQRVKAYRRIVARHERQGRALPTIKRNIGTLSVLLFLIHISRPDTFCLFSAPLGVWAVLGNHEFHGRDTTGTSLMNIDGVRVLINSWAEVRPGLVLAGVDDLTANHRSGLGGDPISKALTSRPVGATILLSHTPWQAEKAASAGTGLMLSGHTHGGQIWPFGYLVQRVYPLLGGRYDVDGMTVIVCRGTGTWGPRMRLWRPGEILRVTLRAAEK